MKKTLAIVLFLIVACWCLPQVSTADQVYFYHNDPAGTPLAMTNSSGAVVWKADYKPFGEEHSITEAAANDRRFVGKEKDEETELSYFGARYEDAKTGRFIAPDSVRAVDERNSKTNEKMLLNPQRFNTYAYALNNPYVYIDPDGKAPLLVAEDPINHQRFFGGGGIGRTSEGLMAPRAAGGGAGRSIGYHATYPEAAESIMRGGFKKGTKPGRLGSHGTYVNNTPEGARAEFEFHNPGVTPKIIEVEYSSGANARASVPPRSYVYEHPIKADSISAPSFRAPGTVNTNVLNGSIVPKRILP